MEGIGILIFGSIVGIYFIWLGLKGREEKTKRDLDMTIPADELPGLFEGTVQNVWWMFVLAGIFAIIVALTEFVKNLT